MARFEDLWPDNTLLATQSAQALQPTRGQCLLLAKPSPRGVSGPRQKVVELHHVRAALVPPFVLPQALSQQPSLWHPLIQEVP